MRVIGTFQSSVSTEVNWSKIATPELIAVEQGEYFFFCLSLLAHKNYFGYGLCFLNKEKKSIDFMACLNSMIRKKQKPKNVKLPDYIVL